MPNNHRDGNNSLEDVRGFNGRAGRGADHGGNRWGNYQGGRGVHRGGKDTGMPRRGIDHGPNRGGNYHGSSGAQREARGGAVAFGQAETTTETLLEAEAMVVTRAD